MTSHRHRVLAAIPAALCLALSASTGALAETPAGDTKADYPGAAPVAKIGDTPGDFAQPVAPAPKAGDTRGDAATGARWTALARRYSSHGAESGDTPADHPGASRAPQYDPPTTITVNRPERTIVRTVNETLPTVLAGLALFVALGSAGFALIRARSLKRGVLGRSH